MNETEVSVNDVTVNWHILQGNKYLKALHPAMLSSNGYLATQKVRLVGESARGGQYRKVLYNRDYIVNWLRKKVIEMLGNQDLEVLVSLLVEAYDSETRTIE